MAALPVALSDVVGAQIVVKGIALDANELAASTANVWTTSNAAVATVQNVLDIKGAGLITCLSAGSATITCTNNALTATFVLTITAALVAGVATVLNVAAEQGYQQIKS